MVNSSEFANVNPPALTPLVGWSLDIPDPDWFEAQLDGLLVRSAGVYEFGYCVSVSRVTGDRPSPMVFLTVNGAPVSYSGSSCYMRVGNKVDGHCTGGALLQLLAGSVVGLAAVRDADPGTVVGPAGDSQLWSVGLD